MGLPISRVMRRAHSSLRVSRICPAAASRSFRSFHEVRRQRGNVEAARATRRSISAAEWASKVLMVLPFAGLMDAMAISAPVHAHVALFQHLEEKLGRHGELRAENPGGVDRAAREKLARDGERHPRVE